MSNTPKKDNAVNSLKTKKMTAEQKRQAESKIKLKYKLGFNNDKR